MAAAARGAEEIVKIGIFHLKTRKPKLRTGRHAVAHLEGMKKITKELFTVPISTDIVFPALMSSSRAG
jgi:hypothetical protein